MFTQAGKKTHTLVLILYSLSFRLLAKNYIQTIRPLVMITNTEYIWIQTVGKYKTCWVDQMLFNFT